MHGVGAFSCKQRKTTKFISPAEFFTERDKLSLPKSKLGTSNNVLGSSRTVTILQPSKRLAPRFYDFPLSLALHKIGSLSYFKANRIGTT